MTECDCEDASQWIDCLAPPWPWCIRNARHRPTYPASDQVSLNSILDSNIVSSTLNTQSQLANQLFATPSPPFSLLSSLRSRRLHSSRLNSRNPAENAPNIQTLPSSQLQVNEHSPAPLRPCDYQNDTRPSRSATCVRDGRYPATNSAASRSQGPRSHRHP
jgi:hypothetical protein